MRTDIFDLDKVFTLTLIFQIFLVAQAVFAQDRATGNKPANNGQKQKKEEVLYRRSYALLVGNSEYSEWNSLPGVERDIPRVEEMLRDKHGFIVEKALNLSKKDLLDRIDQFVSKYGQDYDNRLVIYYAGHGYTAVLPDGRVMGYLVMNDAPIVPPVEESLVKTPKNIGEFRLRAISMGEIENLASEISTRHALFIFDSCFSGTVLYRDNVVNVPKEISPEEFEQMRGFLTAGNEKQRVRDDSPFRRALIKGLEGKADSDGDGYILGSELGAYVKKEVYLETRGTPMPQTPVFGKQERFRRGDMVFVSPRGSRAGLEPDGYVSVKIDKKSNNKLPDQTTPLSSVPPAPATSSRGEKSGKILYSFGARSDGLPAEEIGKLLDEFSGTLIQSLQEKGLTVLNYNKGGLSDSQARQYQGGSNARSDEKAMRLLPVALIVDATIESMEDLPQFQGLFVSKVSGRIDVIDTDNNRTIISERIDQIRGFGNTQDQARRNAMSSAAKNVSDSFLNQIMEKAR